jgi:hypothetical protein
VVAGNRQCLRATDIGRLDVRLPPWVFGDGGSEGGRGNTTIHDYKASVPIPMIGRRTDILI